MWVTEISMSRTLVTFLQFFSTGAIIVVPGIAQAGASAVSPLACNTIYACLNLVLNAVILLAFPIVVLMIVYTGFLFVIAQGNSSKLEAARKALVWTVLGALVVLGAKALSLAIEATVREIRGNAAMQWEDSSHPDRILGNKTQS